MEWSAIASATSPSGTPASRIARAVGLVEGLGEVNRKTQADKQILTSPKLKTSATVKHPTPNCGKAAAGSFQPPMDPCEAVEDVPARQVSVLGNILQTGKSKRKKSGCQIV